MAGHIQALNPEHWVDEYGDYLYRYALSAGDDYQICCTLPAHHRGELENWNRRYPERQFSIIGELADTDFLLHAGDAWIDLGNQGGFRHFD